MTTVAGDPDALEAYAEVSTTTIDAWQDTLQSFRDRMAAYNSAPSDLAHSVIDKSTPMAFLALQLRGTTARPRRFAGALRALDRNGAVNIAGVVRTSDDELFDALVAAFAADPDATEAEAMRDALDSLTGTADELAEEFEGIIEDLDLDRGDIRELQQQLQTALHDVQMAASHDTSQPYPTPEELAERAWERLQLTEAWDGLDPSVGERLATATAKLDRRSDDAAYASDFFEALGADNTIKAAELAAIVGWDDAYRAGGGAPSSSNIRIISEALASGSTLLGRDFADDLIDAGLTDEHEDTNGLWPGGGRDYQRLNDALPLLVSYGDFSEGFSESFGQLGFDVLDGQDGDGNPIDVDRGLGSPWMDGFDELETSWQERGAVFIEMAAGNPAAATSLLQVERNAELLADEQLSWRSTDRVWFDEDVGRWDVIGPALNDLVIAGTVTAEATDPVGAREAAANVIDAVTDQPRNASSDALAPAYAEIVQTYLADFGHAYFDTNLDPFVEGGAIKASLFDLSKFTSRAMADEAGRNAILGQRESLITGLVIVDQTIGLDGPELENQVGSIDAILLTALNDHGLSDAETAQAEAEAYNGRVDLLRDTVLTVLPTDKIPAIGKPLTDEIIDGLTEDLLHRPTNQVSLAEHQLNTDVYDHLGSQAQFVIAGELTVVINQMAHGEALDERQQRVIEVTTDVLGQDYVDALLSRADPTTPDLPLPDVDVQSSVVWTTELSGDLVRDIQDVTDARLPQIPDLD